MGKLRNLFRLCFVAVLLPLLAGCNMMNAGFTGSEGSYPHHVRDRILPIPAGTYEVLNAFNEGDIQPLTISRDNEYGFKIERADAKAGFYRNQADTLVMYVKVGSTYKYYIVEKDPEGSGLIAYNPARAVTAWQKDTFPGARFGRDELPPELTLPYAVAAFNKAFFAQLVANPAYWNERRKAFVIRPATKTAQAQ